VPGVPDAGAAAFAGLFQEPGEEGQAALKPGELTVWIGPGLAEALLPEVGDPFTVQYHDERWHSRVRSAVPKAGCLVVVLDLKYRYETEGTGDDAG